jgi:hypothetical protein
MMMKFPNPKDMDRLIVLYIFVLVVLFIVLIEIPFLVKSGVSIFSEELTELSLLSVVSLTGVFIYRSYRKEVEKKNVAYMELMKHVGMLNRQVEQISSLSKLLKRIPESKNDMKLLLQEMTQRVLEVVPSDWAVIRVIDTRTGKTLTEQSASRGKAVLLKYEISNEELLEGGNIEGYSVLSSNQENIHIKAFCVIPQDKQSDEQKVLIRAIVNDVVLLYLVFTSTYYSKKEV